MFRVERITHGATTAELVGLTTGKLVVAPAEKKAARSVQQEKSVSQRTQEAVRGVLENLKTRRAGYKEIQ